MCRHGMISHKYLRKQEISTQNFLTANTTMTADLPQVVIGEIYKYAYYK